MVRGFYNLTSAMLTQGRRLDVVSQNMVNGSTAGYKEDTYHHIAFEENMAEIIGNTHTIPGTDVGEMHLKVVSSEITTSFEQGVLEETQLSLDFAIEGEGFFAVEWDWEISPYNTVTAEGEEPTEVPEPTYDADGNEIVQTETIVAYTRSGQFSLDAEGYLMLPNYGRVLDQEGNYILLGTDAVECDQFGVITNKYTGEELATLGVFEFEDEGLLERDPRGMFISPEDPVAAENYVIYHGYVERSNTDLMNQMVKMMETQRAYQSCATLSKMYNELMTKATSEIGRG